MMKGYDKKLFAMMLMAALMVQGSGTALAAEEISIEVTEEPAVIETDSAGQMSDKKTGDLFVGTEISRDTAMDGELPESMGSAKDGEPSGPIESAGPSEAAEPSEALSSEKDRYTIQDVVGKDKEATDHITICINMGEGHIPDWVSGNYPPAGRAYNIGDKVLLPAASELTRPGYNLKGFSADKSKADGGKIDSGMGAGKYYTVPKSMAPNSTVTLYPAWKGQKYKISYDLNGGTGKKPPAISYACGTIPKTTPATPAETKYKIARAGFEFKGWSESENAIEPQFGHSADLSSLTSRPYNTTLYAVFAPVTYGVSFNLSTEGNETLETLLKGTPVPEARNISGSTAMTLPVLGDVEGYSFEGWYIKTKDSTKYFGGGTEVTAGELEFLPGSSVQTFYANWIADTERNTRIRKITFKVDSGAELRVDGTKVTLDEGSYVLTDEYCVGSTLDLSRYRAVGKANYVQDKDHGWKYGKTATAHEKITVTKDMTFTVNWVGELYTVHLDDAMDGDHTRSYGTVKVRYGQTVKLPNAAKLYPHMGLKFSQWKVMNERKGKAEKITSITGKKMAASDGDLEDAKDYHVYVRAYWNPGKVSSITVKPKKLAIRAGQEYTVTYTIKPLYCVSGNVTFTTDKPGSSMFKDLPKEAVVKPDSTVSIRVKVMEGASGVETIIASVPVSKDSTKMKTVKLKVTVP